ncbi:MAG TPA: integron [Methyloceanibacter sp.]|nr:integron [Methyloceanibacter sp.]
MVLSKQGSRAAALPLALLSSLAIAGAALAGALAVPVIVGKVAEYDACMSSGAVKGLDPHGDGFLAVRAGPGSQYQMIDKLLEGQNVFVCDERGQWLGVVYTRGSQDCGVTSALNKPTPYPGPCLAGWVHRNFINITAG